MSEETIFADGIKYERPQPGAPEFVKGKFGINVDEFVAFLQKHKNAKGWVNLDFLKSKKGSLYLKLDAWEAKSDGEHHISTEDSPF